jgi:hypothetical protein
MADADDELAAAKANLAEAKTDLAETKAKHRETPDNAEAKLAVAKAELAVAKAEVVIAEAKRAVVEAKHRETPDNAEAKLAVAKAELAVAKAEVVVAEAKRAVAEAEKNDAKTAQGFQVFEFYLLLTVFTFSSFFSLLSPTLFISVFSKRGGVPNPEGCWRGSGGCCPGPARHLHCSRARLPFCSTVGRKLLSLRPGWLCVLSSAYLQGEGGQGSESEISEEGRS